MAGRIGCTASGRRCGLSSVPRSRPVDLRGGCGAVSLLGVWLPQPRGGALSSSACSRRSLSSTPSGRLMLARPRTFRILAFVSSSTDLPPTQARHRTWPRQRWPSFRILSSISEAGTSVGACTGSLKFSGRSQKRRASPSEPIRPWLGLKCSDDRVRGVHTTEGEFLDADAVVCNVDALFAYRNLFGATPPRVCSPLPKARTLDSGVRSAPGRPPGVPGTCAAQHLLLERLSGGVCKRSLVAESHRTIPRCMFQSPPRPTRVMHLPAASNLFILVNVPPLNDGGEWGSNPRSYRSVVLQTLARHGLKDLEKDIVTERVVTPTEFAPRYNAYRGSIYGPSSNSRMAAFLRPPNRARELRQSLLRRRELASRRRSAAGNALGQDRRPARGGNSRMSPIFRHEQVVGAPPERVVAFFHDVGNLLRVYRRQSPCWRFSRQTLVSGPEQSSRCGCASDLSIASSARGLYGWSRTARFSDSLEGGPFKCWDHTHRFEPAGNGTRIVDEIAYTRPPLDRASCGARSPDPLLPPATGDPSRCSS